MVSCVCGLAAWVGSGAAGAAVRAGTASARWARVVPTVLAGTAAPAAATAEACSARWGAGTSGSWAGPGTGGPA